MRAMQSLTTVNVANVDGAHSDVVLPPQRVAITKGCCMCVSVHMLWSLLHDSLISDSSLSRAVNVAEAVPHERSLISVHVARTKSQHSSDSCDMLHTRKCIVFVSILRISWFCWTSFFTVVKQPVSCVGVTAAVSVTLLHWQLRLLLARLRLWRDSLLSLL